MPPKATKPADDPAAEPGADPAAGAPDTGTDQADQLAAARAEADKWKNLSRQHEARAKENAAAAERLKAIEDRDKSELQRATDRANEATRKAEEAERRAQEAELNAIRLKVAATKGLTPSQAARLIGTDEASLTKDADELIASFGGDTGRRPAPTKPTPRLRGGGAEPDDETPDETDPLKMVEAVPRH